MLVSQVRTTVGADHSQYHLAELGSAPNAFTTGGTGLVGPLGDAAVVCCGTGYGSVALTLEVHDGPPALDLDGWDEVVDVSLDLPSARLAVLTLMSGGVAILDLVPGSGVYWVRVQARGRDAAQDDPRTDDGAPVEEHLIAAWPAEHSVQTSHAIVHKAVDRRGAYQRHAEQRRPRGRLSTVEFRTAPAQWSIPDWTWAPDAPSVVVPVDLPVLRSPRLDLTITSVIMYAKGCLMALTVAARQADLDPAAWQRLRDVAQHGFGFPGHSPRRPLHPEALRLSVAWPGQSAVLSAKAPDPDGGRPAGPILVGYGHGATILGDHLSAEHRAWLWPRPPVQPLAVTLEWPGLAVPPTTVTVDGAQLAAAYEAR